MAFVFKPIGVLKESLRGARRGTWQSLTYFISKLGDRVAALAMTRIKVYQQAPVPA
jgi:hypothetical protein